VTKLEAVNSVLRRVGKHPVPALDTGGISEAGRIEAIIDDVERRVQYEGWGFNRRTNVTLTPDSGNGDKITVPDGVISIDIEDGTRKVIQRGDYLYDLDNNTDAFGSAVTVTYTLRMSWCSIPPVIREFIVSEAAKEWNADFGRPQKQSRLEEEALIARQRAFRDDQEAEDTNVFDTHEHRALRGHRLNTIYPTR